MSAKHDESDRSKSIALQNSTSLLPAPARSDHLNEIYWAEAQRLSHTGSFGWKPATGEIIWSDETFRIFEYDPTTKPTTELVLRRVHPEDAARVQHTLQQVMHEEKNYEHEYRLLMPDGSIKHLRVVARTLRDESGNLEFVGAVMDVTAARQLEQTLREREAYLAEAQLQSALSDNFAWLDTVSWTRGTHQLRAGGEIDRVATRRSLPTGDNGYVFFTPAPPVTPATDFQGFLSGSPFLPMAGGGLGNHDYRVPSRAWFVQDDWRARRTLTLNLGFRNEFIGAPYDLLCHTGNTDPTLAPVTGQPFVYPRCVNKFNLAGISGTLNQAGLKNEYATVWEPRVGIAYDVGGHHTTSIRSGYGIYSVREDLGAMDNLAITPPIFPFKVGFPPGPGSLANLFAANGPFPIPALGAPPTQAFVPVPSFFTGFNSCSLPLLQQCSPRFSGTVQSTIALVVPLHWVIGTTQQWNFNLQRQIARDWFAELAYVGTKGTRLRSTIDDNQARLATRGHPLTIPYACGGGPGSCTIEDSTLDNAPARAPYLGIASANFEDFPPSSDSHYNSLQATLGHRFSGGLYFQSAYTFSKSIDDASTASVAFITRVNDQLNPRASRGLSDFDRRHRFVTSAVYELPTLPGNSRLLKTVLDGWETSAVITLQSGAPFTVFDPAGGTAYNLASPSSTATFSPGFGCGNALSSGSIQSRLTNWVKPAAYTSDPFAPLSTGGNSDATLYGNTPRNCIVGPPQKNVDLTLEKVFNIGEGRMSFRSDFFNVFNHPSFANPPSAVVASAGPELPAAGSAPITSVVGTPRLIQLSLKYSF